MSSIFAGTMEKELEFLKILNHSMSYSDYLSLIDSLLLQGKTTGEDQSIAHVQTAPLNRQRIKRLDKTAIISEDLKLKVDQLQIPISFLILTEGWCGDASQSVPYIHKIAAESKGKIKDYYLLRDENLELMNQFLTDGSKAIPKLIAFHSVTGDFLFSWGPRPTAIQHWYMNLKKDSSLSKEELSLQLHQYYTNDKGQKLQEDFIELFNNIS
ncbi:MAG: thioredoxin family protein [Bacteroidetes bacterium]|nr:thioredoxin family protein [Bacteroidota bacterium]